MKKLFLILILFILCLCKTEAQFFDASARNIERLKARKLIVVMQEADPKFIKRISKHPEKVKRYTTIIAETNRTLTRCVQKYWNINDIDFMSYSQCMKNYKDTSFFTISFASLSEDTELLVTKDYSREELLSTANPGRMEIELMENFNKTPFKFNTNPFNRNPVYVWNTPTPYPFEGDLIIAIQQIRNYFSYKYEDPKFTIRNYYNLTKSISFNIAYKTLLLDSAQLKKYDNSFNYVKGEYFSPYKVTSFNEIVNAIKTQDTSFAYVAIVPYHDEIGRGGDFIGTVGGGMDKFSQQYFYMHLVIDAATSTILSISTASMFGNLNGIDKLIDKHSLATYRKHVE